MLKKVESIMSRRLITVPMGTPLSEVKAIMQAHRIRHLPVTDEMDDVIGLVSHTDIAAMAVGKSIPVEFLMSSPVEFIHQDTHIRQAILRMLERKFSCLLIGDDDQNAVGILTKDDLLWCLAHMLESDFANQKTRWNVSQLQTIGAVADKLAQMGI